MHHPCSSPSILGCLFSLNERACSSALLNGKHYWSPDITLVPSCVRMAFRPHCRPSNSFGQEGWLVLSVAVHAWMGCMLHVLIACIYSAYA